MGSEMKLGLDVHVLSMIVRNINESMVSELADSKVSAR